MPDADALRYEWVTDAETFAGLRMEWERLQRSAVKTVFLTWAWLDSYLAEFGSGLNLHVLTAWRGSELVGAFPLTASTSHPRRWTLMGTGTLTPNHLDVIAEPESLPEIRAEFARMLSAERRRWDSLVFDKMPADSDSVAALQEAFGSAGFATTCAVSAICPFCELPPSFEAYLAKRSKRVRKKLRVTREILANQGERARVERADSSEEALKALARLMELHQQRWTEKGYPGAFASPAVMRFHERVVRASFAEGTLRMYSLWDGDEIVCVSYDFIIGDLVQAYLSSFDPKWEEWSPGVLTRSFVIERSIAEGATRFDFLEGTERYKSDWCDCNRENLRLTIYGRTAVGQALRMREWLDATTIVLARRWASPELRERVVKLLAWRRHKAAEPSDTQE